MVNLSSGAILSLLGSKFKQNKDSKEYGQHLVPILFSLESNTID